jgi:hypothetical protein
MPIPLTHYDIEVEVTVRIREKTSQIPLAIITLTGSQTANSYDPKQMIPYVVAERLGRTDENVMSQVRVLHDRVQSGL